MPLREVFRREMEEWFIPFGLWIHGAPWRGRAIEMANGTWADRSNCPPLDSTTVLSRGRGGISEGWLPVQDSDLNAFVFNDAVVTHVVLSLVKSIQMGAPNLYVESAAQFLAKHLLSMQSTWPERDIERRRPEVLTDRRLTRVLEYMSENISNPISLNQLAREACISRFHFVKCFRESLGITPHRYLVRLRMLQGATLLKNTDRSVSEIAIACGYATTAHFCAAFHDYHQQTALQYRQMARGGSLSEALLDDGGPRHEWMARPLS